MNRPVVWLACVMVFAGCERVSREIEPATPSTTGVQPVDPAEPDQPEAPVADGEISGQVVETMDAGGYTYAKLDRGGAQIWVAGPITKLAVGDRLGRMQGNEMPGFHSNTLNRTFDQIYFVQAYAQSGGEVARRPPATAAAPMAAEGDGISGTVLETMNAGGYTYAQLDRGGTKVWVAGPETKLAVGTKLGRMTGQLMTKFRSEKLARTFDEIYFITAYAIGGDAVAAPAGAPPATNPHAGTPAAANPHGDAPVVADKIDAIPPAPGGKTVADVFAGKATLAGKAVVVRGKVVKVTTGVLGKNWLHLRDGTGGAGTNDLIVTTQATPTVGDIVVARGAVAVDKDFGAGYTYPVLLEDATLAAK